MKPSPLLSVSAWVVALGLVVSTACYCDEKANASSLTVLELTLDDAEKLFRENNLDLLAARFGIEIAESNRIKASLCPNPNLSLEQNIYNNSTGRYFDFSRYGNTEVQVSQLVRIAGKPDKQLRVSEHDKTISEQLFSDLSRNLLFQLRISFYRIYWQTASLPFFERSLGSLKRTIQSAETAYQKRAILLSEVLRLKSLYTQLQSDWIDTETEISNAQSDIRTLLFRETKPNLVIRPMVDVERLQLLGVSKTLDELLDMAQHNRPDLKLLETSVKREQTNLSLQHSLAVPDLTLSMRYSRAGSYIQEYFAFAIGIDLPFFDRNQDGILGASAQLQLNEALNRRAIMDLRHDLEGTYQRAIETDRAVRHIDPSFVKDYDSLVEKMIHNYQNRNIGIIAFADFYESYRTSMMQYRNMQLKRLTAFEELNRGVGTTVVQAKGDIK